MKKKNDKPIDLSEKDFSFVCPLQTEDMTAVEGGYFCGECEKKVHDVSGMSKCEYDALVSKTDNICVTFKRVATVSLALSLAACTSPQKPKPVLMGKIASPNSTYQTPPSKNKLAPYKTIDTNKTVEISGVPEFKPKEVNNICQTSKK
ncbi:MAG TPA: hypothetical protein ENK90_03540 [Epsilonproteobacteria bacterium]|nr:hypothetical protein [Campylobacterota bacterium]